jgi:hypothetical protein
MQLHSLASSESGFPASVSEAKRRRQYRQPIKNLAYVNLQPSNGAILRNVSQNGIAVQAVAPLQPGQTVQLRFELLNPRVRVEIAARVIWSDRMGQAGLEFMQLPPRVSHALKDWIFAQLLAAADHSFGVHSIFSQSALAETGSPQSSLHGGLPATLDQEKAGDMLDLPWFPFSLSPRTLSLVIDCLILLCAVFVFEFLSLAMTKVFPMGWAGAGLLLFTVVSFCCAYWFLFERVAGATPGKVLVDCAAADQDGAAQRRDDDRPRFR